LRFAERSGDAPNLSPRFRRRLARENAFGEREENACAPSSPKATQGEREEFSRAESLDEKKRISRVTFVAPSPSAQDTITFSDSVAFNNT